MIQNNPYMNMYNGMYNPYVQQPVIPNYQQMQQPQATQVIWVQGEAAARAYQLSPGERVFLMDSENPFMYAREADATGKPLKMKKIKLVEVDDNAPDVDMSQYVKMSDISGMIASAVEDEVNRRMSEITLKPTSSRRAKEE